ncbi:TonB-dependent receptor [Candidatus Albibeggiatoa sp. nov. BB20]|uniref:TonB-dependent receptor plug domain-containing protein n=1 Tax=Candidatus Albibeggiatoa sp. nov. BB20 TaxID=3162723 RepID=UPI0033653579
MRKKSLFLYLIFVFMSISKVLYAVTDMEYLSIKSLSEMTLAELMNVQVVTSINKRPQKIFETGAAVFIITQEDIMRSGATHIADVLRLAPGIQVNRVNSHGWAVSARGFNDYYANKLLVLIDGRNTYSPLFSGTFWDAQDTVLEDIERIEIIRGSGGTVWGSNAVNGVVNIITKKTQDTQGGLLSIITGTEDKYIATARYGGKIGENGYYKIYTKSHKRDNFGVDTLYDAWSGNRVGFRTDFELEQNNITVQGDYYNADNHQPSAVNTFQSEVQGITTANILGRWEHQFSETSDLSIQMYYNRNKYNGISAAFTIEKYDFDLQHRFNLNERNEIIWGMGYRVIHDKISDTPVVHYEPSRLNRNLISLFIQNSLTLVPERWKLTFGSKFEHNSFTGWESQPNIRLLYMPNERQSFWAAISRAVRIPSRSELHVELSLAIPDNQNPFYPIPFIFQGFGNENKPSEDVLSYELGLRQQINEDWFIDISTFYNQYKNLSQVQQDINFDVNRVVMASRNIDDVVADTFGIEFATTWQTTENWSVDLAYNIFYINMEGLGQDDLVDGAEVKDPTHQLSLRSALDVTTDTKLDLWLKFVGNSDNPSTGKIKHYTILDARFAWDVTPNLELSIVGQNLLDKRHFQFAADRANTLSTEVERGGYLQLRWQFD